MGKTTLLLAGVFAATATFASAQDFSGTYGGVQIGGSDIDTNADLTGSGNSVGAFVGFNNQSGGTVFGGEFDYDSTEYSIGDGAVNVESTLRLKGKIGALAGNGMVYGTAGLVRATTDVLGDSNGTFFGAGYDYSVNESTTAGVEVLMHNFDDFDGSGIDVDVMTYKLRVAFKF